MTVFLTGRSVLALSLSIVCGNVILWRTIDDLSPVLCLCLLYYRQAHGGCTVGPQTHQAQRVRGCAVVVHLAPREVVHSCFLHASAQVFLAAGCTTLPGAVLSVL